MNSITYNNEIVIYDYFIRDKILYLVSTYWSDIVKYRPLNKPRLKIKINYFGKEDEFEDIGYDENEPLRYFRYKLDFVIENFIYTIKINEKEYNIIPEVIKVPKNKYKFGIATLFKDETPYWIEKYIEYYDKQGVDVYYFYFNGKEIPKGVPKRDNIHYIKWDYIYWINGEKYRHLAQMVFLMDFRLKYYNNCEWVALIDLDEYVYNNKRYRILDFLNRVNADYIIVENHWAKLNDDKIIEYEQEGNGYKSRTKVIYNTSRFDGYFGIHLPKEPKNGKRYNYMKARNLEMLHLIDVLHPDREERIKTPVLKSNIKII